ncbi:hypothetical protein [Bacillus sp. OAE603]|uniref:hypothetical protein n=1 Tax=Gottfriedia sp. OAE603 TaxID=2663872 RepID=UPI0017896622
MKKRLVKYSLVVTLFLISIGVYGWYRYVNRDVITVGDFKTEKETMLVNNYGYQHESSVIVKNPTVSSEESCKILKGKDFYTELNKFRSYLQNNGAKFDDTILTGNYELTTRSFTIEIGFREDEQAYYYIWFYFDPNNRLTAITTNGMVGMGVGERIEREREIRGYETIDYYNFETKNEGEALSFSLQTDEFFNYLSKYSNETPFQFVSFMKKELKPKSKASKGFRLRFWEPLFFIDSSVLESKSNEEL